MADLGVMFPKQMRLQVRLFSVAVPLHLVWEVAQIGAYDFGETGLIADMIGCLVPSLGDGLMTLMIYWTGWAVFRDSGWILRPRLKGYVVMTAAGFILAVLVEWNALYRTGGWAYNEQMVMLPFLRVGLLPILQMVLLPPLTAVLVRRAWQIGSVNAHERREFNGKTRS